MHLRHLLPALLALALAGPARADFRHFGWMEEPDLVPAGEAELELWTTVGLGAESDRVPLHRRIGPTVQLQLGLSERLQVTAAISAVGLRREVDFSLPPPCPDSPSCVAAPSIGVDRSGLDELRAGVEVALSSTPRGGTSLTLGAGTFRMLAHEALEVGIRSASSSERHVLAWDLLLRGGRGAGYDPDRALLAALGGIGSSWTIGRSCHVGLELRSEALVEIGSDVDPYVSLYAGPSIGYRGERFWTVLSVLPQLPAPLTRSDTTFNTSLGDGELLQARLQLAARF